MKNVIIKPSLMTITQMGIDVGNNITLSTALSFLSIEMFMISIGLRGGCYCISKIKPQKSRKPDIKDS